MENEIIQTVGVEVIEAQERAAYDIQIATAQRFPRNINKVREGCLAIITMDKETAESCRYVLPRGGKNISGPSVHMARIIAQQFRNLRIDARVKQVSDNQVVSESVCFDLEMNYAAKVEVRRSIFGKQGRYNEDMITVTGNASNAIAFRNAVFAVIPKALVDVCYKKAMEMITGDLSDETKLIKERTRILDRMKESYNVTDEQILKVLGLRSVNQIKTEQIADLIGIGQSIKDGDTTIEEVFRIAPEIKPDGPVTLKRPSSSTEQPTKEEKPTEPLTMQNPE